MAQLTPRSSANRAVRDYRERHYLPAAAAYRERAADHGSLGRKLCEWRRATEQAWDRLQFGQARVNTRRDGYAIEVDLHMNGMDPASVRVQLHADTPDEANRVREMHRITAGSSGPDLYRATLSGALAVSEYTARVIPAHANISVPLECARITWQF